MKNFTDNHNINEIYVYVVGIAYFVRVRRLVKKTGTVTKTKKTCGRGPLSFNIIRGMHKKNDIPY